jgi:putative MATE family efflux protein
VRAQSSLYLAIVMPALPIAVAGAVAAGSLHARGDTRTPFAAAALGALVNAALTLALVTGPLGVPRLGIAGAALGSAAGLVLQGAWLLHALHRRLPRRGSASPAASLRALGDLSLPVVAERLIYHAAYAVYAGVVGTLGPSALAAHQSLLALEAPSHAVAEGFAIAAAALTARRVGAGDRAAYGGCSAALIPAIALGALAVVGFLLVPQALLGMFSADPEVIGAGTRALGPAALAQPFMAAAIVLSAALRAAGYTARVMAITLLCACVVRLTAAWLFTVVLDLGLAGVWLASGCDWLAQALVLGMVVLHVARRRAPLAGRPRLPSQERT